MGYKTPVAIREYNFSDGLLEQLADQVKLNISRDVAQLAVRGITATTISNLETLINNFKDTPNDTDARGTLTEKVEEKDAARNTMLIAARTLRTAAQNKFQVGTGKYNRFGFDGMDKLKDEELYRAAKGMHRVGLSLQAQLADEGIDAAFLANFLSTITAFDNAIDQVGVAAEQRDKLTEERSEAGNVLYKEIVRLCNIGKDFFAPISEATYNDYVIDNYVGNSSVVVLAEYQDFISANATVNLGLLPTAGKILRLTVISGVALEIGLSVDGTTFNGNTTTQGGPGTITILITDLASAGSIILVRNQSLTLQAQYKVEVLG